MKTKSAKTIVKWTDEGAFRPYPPKFDVKYADRLPDPSITPGYVYSVAIPTEINISTILNDKSPPNECIFKRIDFVRVCYYYENKIVYDWKQLPRQNSTIVR